MGMGYSRGVGLGERSKSIGRHELHARFFGTKFLEMVCDSFTVAHVLERV